MATNDPLPMNVEAGSTLAETPNMPSPTIPPASTKPVRKKEGSGAIGTNLKTDESNPDVAAEKSASQNHSRGPTEGAEVVPLKGSADNGKSDKKKTRASNLFSNPFKGKKKDTESTESITEGSGEKSVLQKLKDRKSAILSKSQGQSLNTLAISGPVVIGNPVKLSTMSLEEAQIKQKSTASSTALSVDGNGKSGPPALSKHTDSRIEDLETKLKAMQTLIDEQSREIKNLKNAVLKLSKTSPVEVDETELNDQELYIS